MAIDLTRISTLHLGLLAGACALAYATRWADAGSVLLGGAVMGVNFWLLRLIGVLLRPDRLDPGKRGRTALAVGALLLKFTLFLALLAALFWRLPIAGMSFAFGATLLLVACVLEALRSEWPAGTGRAGVGHAAGERVVKGEG